MVRDLTDSDVAAAYELSSLAGWNQTPEDWQMMLETGDTCAGIDIGGRLVATATLICYGTKLGWIGMVLTHPDFRRRGFARMLVRQLFFQAFELGVKTVKLDATDDGRPLYESLGFRAEQPVERWERKGTAEQPELGRTRIATEKGYVCDRPGRLNRYLGPCVAEDAAEARSLISETISRAPESGWFWDLLPANEAAVAIAREFGFERVRALTRMACGRELRENEDAVFAIAGFELG